MLRGQEGPRTKPKESRQEKQGVDIHEAEEEKRQRKRQEDTGAPSSLSETRCYFDIFHN